MSRIFFCHHCESFFWSFQSPNGNPVQENNKYFNLGPGCVNAAFVGNNFIWWNLSILTGYTIHNMHQKHTTWKVILCKNYFRKYKILKYKFYTHLHKHIKEAASLNLGEIKLSKIQINILNALKTKTVR